MVPQYQFYQSTFNNDAYTNAYSVPWSSYHNAPKSPPLVNAAMPGRPHMENLGIESPDMIPRNLLDGLTPALSPQMQPTTELPPMNLSLPPSSGNRMYVPSSCDYISVVNQNPQLSYGRINATKNEIGKTYLQPVHMKPGISSGDDRMGDMPLHDRNYSTLHMKKQAVDVSRDRVNQKVFEAQMKKSTAPSLSKDYNNPLLDDFHNRMTSRWSLLDLRGNIYEFSKDQDGSRFIQRQMEVAPDDVKFMIIQELVNHADILTKDVFGNYVIQKALEYGTVDQRISIVERLMGNIPELTLHTYACRVVQKALEYIQHSLRLEIARELHDVTLTCIYDQNGNHVLQKCIEVIPDNVDFIVNALKGNIWGVACHAYGCRVMQRLLEQSPIALRNANDLLQEILSHAKELTRNQYGNYVVQHLLISSGSKYRDAIVDIVLPEFFELACHKFASNVIEKVIVFSENENHEKLMHMCFTEKDSEGVLCLVKLVTNPFGNYVVQRLFEFGTKEEKVHIASVLASHMSLIERNSCSRHILPFILANAKTVSEKSEELKSNKPIGVSERRPDVSIKPAHNVKSMSDSMENLSIRSPRGVPQVKGQRTVLPNVVRANHLPPSPTMPYPVSDSKSFNSQDASEGRAVYAKPNYNTVQSRRPGSAGRGRH